MTAGHIPGDRTRPRLPVQPHLRAVSRRGKRSKPVLRVTVFSRVNGKFPVADGALPIADALALLVAGEA